MRQELEVVVVPSRRATRLWATARGRRVLTATLPPIPWHSEALPMLLAALGRWEPLPIHAVVVAGASFDLFVTSLCRAWHAGAVDGASLEVVAIRPRNNR